MASIDTLKTALVGKTLHQVDPPAAVLDLAKLEVNCQRMLDTAKRLGLGWRAHIKTHKTTELTRLQVGDALSSPANIVVSTILEAENITPLLQEYRSRGRSVNLLYGFPLPSSAVARLSAVLSALGPGSVSVIVDHPGQLPHVRALKERTGHAPWVFLKINGGDGRAGILVDSEGMMPLVEAIVGMHTKGECVFHGAYSHAGSSYASRTEGDAMGYMAGEFATLEGAATKIRQVEGAGNIPLVLSLGATPTATSLESDSVFSTYDGKHDSADSHGAASTGGGPKLAALIRRLQTTNLAVEVHAGVYPTLDLQQLATHARTSSFLSASDIAITILAEVVSLYPGRGPNGTTEALVTAGSLALGREPCPGAGYSGWGIVAPWGVDNPVPGPEFPTEKYAGWLVRYVSQEHGILAWTGSKTEEVQLKVGQRFRVWPHHSCIAGAGFGWYLVVDSRRENKDEIVDVWPRWRGW